MDQITRILEKLNQQRSGETTVTLADFMPCPLQRSAAKTQAGYRVKKHSYSTVQRKKKSKTTFSIPPGC